MIRHSGTYDSDEFFPGDDVVIIGWPPLHKNAHLRARVLKVRTFIELAVVSVTVELITGTSFFPPGEYHEFPANMVVHTEKEQMRLI